MPRRGHATQAWRSTSHWEITSESIFFNECRFDFVFGKKIALHQSLLPAKRAFVLHKILEVKFLVGCSICFANVHVGCRLRNSPWVYIRGAKMKFLEVFKAVDFQTNNGVPWRCWRTSKSWWICVGPNLVVLRRRSMQDAEQFGLLLLAGLTGGGIRKACHAHVTL